MRCHQLDRAESLYKSIRLSILESVTARNSQKKYILPDDISTLLQGTCAKRSTVRPDIDKKACIRLTYIEPFYFDGLIHVFGESRKRKIDERILQISKDIKKITTPGRTKTNPKTALKLKKLFQELRSLMRLIISKNRRVLRLIQFEANVKPRDQRTLIRQVSTSLHKQLPDFSGCEEEAGFTISKVVNPIALFSQLKKSCITLNSCSAQLIPSQRLPMSG